MWTTARLTIYLTAFFGALATLFAALGWGTYDAATGDFTVTINVGVATTWVVGVLGNGLAAVAVWRGWGAKK